MGSISLENETESTESQILLLVLFVGKALSFEQFTIKRNKKNDNVKNKILIPLIIK